MDVETASEHATCLTAMADAETANLKAAVSNPAFEFWYILHFVETTRKFANAADAEFFLSTYLKGYTKTSDVLDDVYANTDAAISRAQHLLENYPRPGTRFPNPSTRVHELVTRLMEIAAR